MAPPHWFGLCAALFVPAQSLSGKTFIVSNASRHVEEFRAIAGAVSALKKHGRVQINSGTLAGKSRRETPEQGSARHEYANYVSTPAKSFPHPKIAPHFPAEWVANNRALLLAKAGVLRAARMLEQLENAPEQVWLKRLSIALRMWVSEVRSIHNFDFAQRIRGRNRELPAAKQATPGKTPAWTRHPDYLEWSAIQRADLDITNELLHLLDAGGL